MFRSTKIRDKYIVTTDHGSWIVLDSDEYQNLMEGKSSEKLEKSCIIFTKENRNDIIGRYHIKNEFLFQATSLHIINVTSKCNQSCVYCQASEKKSESVIDEEIARKTVDFIFQSPSPGIAIEFQGGEPLLAFDKIKLITEYAQEKNKKYNKLMKFNIVSNLSVMTDEIMDYCAGKNIKVCTSLDGPKNVHDKNRCGTYNTVVDWIKKLKEKKILGGALPTITRQSLPFHKEIIDEYANLGLISIHVRFLHRLGAAGKNWDEIGYTAEEFIDFWKKSMDYIIELNKKGMKIMERMAFNMLSKIILNYEQKYSELQSPCGGIIGQLAYMPDGSVYTCDCGRMFGEPFMLGNVKENTFREVACSPAACSFIMMSTNDTLLCDACAWKPYCGVCPVCTYAEQGNLLPKLAMSDRCKIYKAMFVYVMEKYIFDSEAKAVFDEWLKEIEH